METVAASIVQLNAIIGIILSIILVGITGVLEFFSCKLIKDNFHKFNLFEKIVFITNFVIVIIVQLASIASVVLHILEVGGI